MEPYYSYLNKLANRHRLQFSEYPDIRWINSSQANKIQAKMNQLSASLNWLYKNTKPYYNHISPGCKLCGDGKWSCLFITNQCNANCFYCPSPQIKDEIPATQSLTFDTAESYADYITLFGFKGVSFSGGEPLLYFDRTLHYLKTVRRLCAPDVYIWMYTNGILGTKEKFQQLAEAGLNEIRFDIGATGYRLDKAKLASGIIPVVTVEIPAVPDKKEKIKQLIPEMAALGIANLNLHQLRLTKHNAPKLLKQNYTYIPAEQPVVLESELAAMEIIETARTNNYPIGINYCSFFYKNRYQAAGFRKLMANAVGIPELQITEKGYIREYNENSISYKTSMLSEIKENRNDGIEFRLTNKICHIKTETVKPVIQLSQEQKIKVDQLLNKEPDSIPDEDYLFQIWQMEYIERGIRDY